MIYLLVLCTHVYSGDTCTFKEFKIKSDCEYVIAIIKKDASVDVAKCMAVPK